MAWYDMKFTPLYLWHYKNFRNFFSLFCMQICIVLMTDWYNSRCGKFCGWRIHFRLHICADDLWFLEMQPFFENINKHTKFILLPWLSGGICNQILYIFAIKTTPDWPGSLRVIDSYCSTPDIDFSNGPSTGPCGTPAVPNCQHVSTVAICWANDWHPSTGEPI